MRFRDLAVFREQRFALGFDNNTGKHYLSIPVVNRLIEYDEYYEINRQTFDEWVFDHSAAAAFAERARRRELDHLLILSPGSDRGEPT